MRFKPGFMLFSGDTTLTTSPSTISLLPTRLRILRTTSGVRPWLLVLIFALVYTGILLSLHGWDPLSFVNLGERYDPAKSNQSLGYDGQFYYQIAKDPANAWKLVDVPAYRYQRILYPLAAYALSFGQANWLPWILILINLVAISLGTLLMEKILAYHQVSRGYALVYGLFIGTLFSLRLDLGEPMAYLFVMAAILSFLRQHPWQSSAWFACASITRETTLLFAAGYVIFFLIQKKILWTGLWAASLAAPFLLWHLFLKIWLGDWGSDLVAPSRPPLKSSLFTSNT